MAQRYADAKICLVLHAFGADTPLETHRLSEFAKSGCIPVMEESSDVIGKEMYASCGGVVFSDLSSVPFKIAKILSNPEKYEERVSNQILWWQRTMEWQNLLKMVFD